MKDIKSTFNTILRTPKTLLVFTAVALLIFAIVILQKPIQLAKERIVYPEQFILTPGYTKNDLIRAFAFMRKNPEYDLYFSVLSRHEAGLALTRAAVILLNNRDQKSLRNEIHDLKIEVEDWVRTFYYFEYPADFHLSPSSHGLLSEVYKELIIKEFQLVVLGTFYKGTYDRQFRFEWDYESKMAVEKLTKITDRVHQANLKKRKNK